MLAGIMGTMYLSSRVSFETSSQVARAQENLRFSTFYLQRALRETSYSKCGADNPITVQLNTSSPNYFGEATQSGVMGWEYNGTDQSDTFELSYRNLDDRSVNADIIAARADNAGAAGQWDNDAGADLPDIIESLSPLVGSDIIMLSAERESSGFVSSLGTTASAELVVTDNDSELTRGKILKVGNCSQMDKFQNAVDSTDRISTGVGGNSGTYESDAGTPWSVAHQANTPIYIETTTIFYVGTGSGGLPSLFRYQSECGLAELATGCAENLELVEGVENMQLFYGEDTDNDQVADIYRAADNVNNFDNVVSLRVGLLLRSLEETEDNDINTYTLSDVVTIDPDDLRAIRFVNNLTIHLRNRGV